MANPELIQTKDGRVIFGAELTLSPDIDWRPTVTQVRDAILEFRVTGWEETGLPLLPEAQEYRSSVEEVSMVSSAARNAVSAGRVIDFGHLPNLVISQCAKRGGKLWNMGALGFPFRDPWICYHTWDHKVLWKGKGPHPWNLPEVKAVAVYLVNQSDDSPNFEVFELQPMRFRGDHLLVIGDRGMFMTPPEGGEGHVSCVAPAMTRFLANDEARAAQNNGESPQQAASCNIGDPIICALMILATRGVERETIKAPEKLQRARAKNRKPPIPNYDRVLSEPYVTAILASGQREKSEGLGGTHASPIFHIRRGHPRNYATGRSIWISDTLVNANDEQRRNFKGNRSHYEVRP